MGREGHNQPRRVVPGGLEEMSYVRGSPNHATGPLRESR